MRIFNSQKAIEMCKRNGIDLTDSEKERMNSSDGKEAIEYPDNRYVLVGDEWYFKGFTDEV